MISTTTNRVVLNGDGSSVSFSYPYEFFAQADLKVYLYNSSAPGAVLQTLNTNYSIGGTPNFQGIYPNGGTVIFTSSVPSTQLVIITRDGSQVQNYQLLQNGQINSVALVQQLDYLTLLTQRLQDQANRALHLPEGFGLAFDMNLPYAVTQMAGQSLIVNSGANGFTFQSLNAAYIPNTVIVAVSSSVIGSLGGGPAGYVLQSNGSSAPTWAAVSLSGSSVSGNLSLGNGGTGGLVPQQWGVVFCSSATQLATTDPAPTGMALISNASSAPTFQQLDLASAVTGTLAVNKGGTNLTAYTQYALIYASATGVLGQIPSAQSGYVLTAQGSSAPVWSPASGGAPAGSSALLVVNNLSDVPVKATAFNNISPTTTRGDIIFAGSAAVNSRLAAGGAGQVLTTQGNQADPTWTSVLVNPMTTFGDTIYAGSAAVTSRLAGSISNSSAVLMQTGSGGVSTAPVWTTVKPPLVTKYVTVGSSTHTMSAGVIYARVIAVGAGGGGAGGGSAAGSGGGTGGSTFFGTNLIVCMGGGGGSFQASTGPNGGNASLGTGPVGIAFAGGKGSAAGGGSVASAAAGAGGASSPLGGGGGGAATTGSAGVAGTGGGGGGGGNGAAINSVAGASGAAGGYIDAYLYMPILGSSGGVFAVSIGAGGTAGTAGTSGGAGSIGGDGSVHVIEFFGA